MTLIAATAVIGQARSSSENDYFFPEVQSGGSYLGIRLADIDADRAKALKLDEPRGAEVTRVENGSPAEKALIKPGDVILSYNSEDILGAQQLGRLVRETPVGRKVRFRLWRDGRAQSVTVITEARRGPAFDLPVGMGHFEMPDVRSMIRDVPSPMLMWGISALGLECEAIDSQLADYFGVQRGLLVRSVTKGSPAERAGVKAGDVLTSIGDRPVANPHDVTGFLRMQQEQGRRIPIVVMREHKQLTINVVPLEYPQ